MPDPSVSPADTIRHDLVLLRNDSDRSQFFRDDEGWYHARECRGCKIAALLAVGERDKAEIDRLTEKRSMALALVQAAEAHVAELEAERERDRQHIERLTEALERLVNEGYLLVPAANGLIRYAEAAKSDTEQGHRPEGAIMGYDLRRESFASAVNAARAVLADKEDARPTVEPNERITWGDVRPGDAISLLVMSTEFGLVREVRSVVAVDWPKITLAEGARCYEIDATKPDNLNRAIERMPRAAGEGDT